MESNNSEKLLGNPLTNVALSVGVAVAGPALVAAGLSPDPYAISLLGIVPGLAQSAIGERHVQRTKETLEAMRQDVQVLQIDVERLTEEQYKLGNH